MALSRPEAIPPLGKTMLQFVRVFNPASQLFFEGRQRNPPHIRGNPKLVAQVLSQGLVTQAFSGFVVSRVFFRESFPPSPGFWAVKV